MIVYESDNHKKRNRGLLIAGRFIRGSIYVDSLADIRRVAKECIEVFPVGTPAFADLRIFVVPLVCKHIQRHQRRLFGQSRVNRLQSAGDSFVVLHGYVFQAVTHHMDDAQLELALSASGKTG